MDFGTADVALVQYFFLRLSLFGWQSMFEPLFCIVMCFLVPLLLPLGRWLTVFSWLVLMTIVTNIIVTVQAMLQLEIAHVADDALMLLFLITSFFFLCLGLIIRLIAVKLLTRYGYQGYGDLHGFKSWWKGNHPPTLHRLVKVFLLLPLMILVTMVSYLFYAYAETRPQEYCVKEKRIIPKDELCATLYDSAIERGDVLLGPTEKNGRDYLVNHPNNCHVGPEDNSGFRLGGLFEGLFEGRLEATFDYELPDKGPLYKGDTNTKPTLYSEWDIITPCGEIKRRSGV
ncbi:hypothetical protein ACO0K9_26220 [Undibacterium sp. Ji50W]|uniref:hypothetical protein n=1 Tax=Undibacterium sp. Ji50W TaxID=3413041 RepID=UPI003BF2C127